MMTNEEAKEFLDNLKTCINEHPIVADWLVEIADRKDEPQTITIEGKMSLNEWRKICPENPQFKDEPQTAECPFDDTIPCEWVCTEYGKCKYKPKTEPQTSGIPYKIETSSVCKDEPQYDIDKGTIKCDNCSENGSYKCSKCDGEMYFKRLEVEDEPQIDAEEVAKDINRRVEMVKKEWKARHIEDEPQTDCSWK